MYDTHEEANQKLRHTVVLFNKSPVYIHEAGGSKDKVTLTFNYIRNGTTDMKPINSRDFEFRSLGGLVGYSNIELGAGSYNETLYLTRMPVRQAHSTQGLSAKNISIPAMKGSAKFGVNPMRVEFSFIYPRTAFADMLEDKYPTLYSLEREFSKKSHLCSKAFHRQFAIRRDEVGPFYLQYRGKDIGHTDDFNKWKIAPQYDYLRETMDHLNLKVQ